jgi:hypothetical protein
MKSENVCRKQRYAARIPSSIQTSDDELKFDGLPEKAVVQKIYHNLDSSGRVEAFTVRNTYCTNWSGRTALLIGGYLEGVCSAEIFPVSSRGIVPGHQPLRNKSVGCSSKYYVITSLW